LYIKILTGDKSDNIPGCFRRCGTKTALKLIHNPLLLKEKLDNDINAKMQYQLNSQLIDFSNIPKELLDSINIHINALDI